MRSNWEIEQIIVEKELLLKQALIDLNVKTLDELIDESFIFTIRGLDLTKSDYLNLNKENHSRLYSSNLFLQIYRYISEEKVDIELWTELDACFKGQKIVGKYKYTHTWIADNGTFKLLKATIICEEVIKEGF